MFKSLLIATDGSELGHKALATAIDLAKTYSGKLLILTATDPVATVFGTGGFGTIDAGAIVAEIEHTYAQSAHTLLAEAKGKAEAAGIPVSVLYAPRQHAADAIVGAAEEEGCDAIVMGSHGRRGFGRLLLGSQAAEVLARARVPVLIVK